MPPRQRSNMQPMFRSCVALSSRTWMQRFSELGMVSSWSCRLVVLWRPPPPPPTPPNGSENSKPLSFPLSQALQHHQESYCSSITRRAESLPGLSPCRLGQSAQSTEAGGSSWTRIVQPLFCSRPDGGCEHEPSRIAEWSGETECSLFLSSSCVRIWRW
jgi:hypothetical protein